MVIFSPLIFNTTVSLYKSSCRWTISGQFAQHHVATVIGNVRPLVTEMASGRRHIAGQWDLNPLPEALVERQWNGDHVQIVDVQLDVVGAWNQRPRDVPELQLEAMGVRAPTMCSQKWFQICFLAFGTSHLHCGGSSKSEKRGNRSN
jgi:hypothetical protein